MTLRKASFDLDQSSPFHPVFAGATCLEGVGAMAMVRCGSLLLALAIMVATSLSASAQQPATTPPSAAPAAAPAQPDQTLLKPEQLEALVAPIALYPDALLANMLAAATYPLEVVEADRWVKE